jgi:isocitrate dehydrogenase kinase/phosphatase
MARNNIFPGDMLLKNFGVSRHGRAVFYDYDELCLVTDCHFRDWPQPTCYEEEMADGPWFYVGPGDVFPERFPQFLGLPAPQASALRAAHGDLFGAGWWRDLQARLAAGDYPDTPPYPDALKLA